MTDSLLDPAPLAPEPADIPLDAPAATARPEHVPETFWDADAGRVRVDDLARAYAELAGADGSGAERPPARPDDYDFALQMPIIVFLRLVDLQIGRAHV